MRRLRNKFIGATTVGERGQVVIPAEARKALGINSGDKLLVFSHRHPTGLLLLKDDVFNELVSETTEEKLTEIERQSSEKEPDKPQ